MADYKLSHAAKDDLIRIYQFGVKQFGMLQADKYFDAFFQYFDMISQQPYAFENIDYIKPGYRRCACGSDSIYYKIENGTLEIIATIGRQDLNNIV
jgi:toxin ParE1/3/4